MPLSLLNAALIALIPMASAETANPAEAMRSRMADLHQKMADCLRSEKSVSQCQRQGAEVCAYRGDTSPPLKAPKDKKNPDQFERLGLRSETVSQPPKPVPSAVFP